MEGGENKLILYKKDIMKTISNKTWNNLTSEQANEIKNFLLNIGGEEKEVKTQYEVWRIRYSDATLTYYSSGKLFCTESDDLALEEVHNFIYTLIGSQFISPNKDYLIGLDETGKGEVIGHTVLAGVLIPANLFKELEVHIGTANTKVKHTVNYWDDVYRKIDLYKDKGLNYIIQKIPPWQIDKYNINRILDVTYQRILNSLLPEDLEKRSIRIVLDDYGIGFHLNNFLNALKNSGAEIIKQPKADEIYLESRIASLVSKREQQKVIEAITKDPEYNLNGLTIGSGNAGDSITTEWLKEWKKTGKEWPWFVKRSFKTIRELDGINTETKKIIPPIKESLLSKEFIERFNNGEFSIASLALFCSKCGTSSKALKLIPKNYKTTPVCLSCNNEFSSEETSLTLQYYCGKILPDSSAINRGFISKDLEGIKFFENFTFLLCPIVKQETDKTKGGKSEIEKLSKFAAIGRIRLEETSFNKNNDCMKDISNDELILQDAKNNNAILITADKHMRGLAQTKNIFTIWID